MPGKLPIRPFGARRSHILNKIPTLWLARSADATSVFVVASLAALCFAPTLHSGLSDADGYLRHLSAVVGFDRVSPSAVYAETARHYGLQQPGWFPLGPLPLALWLTDPPQSIVKLLQFAMVVFTFATFAVLARTLFRSTQASVVAAVIALTVWQLRMPHDPVIGTSFVMPVLAEWVLLSFVSWLAYRATRKAIWLGISCATVAVMMLTDPLGCGFAVLLAALAALDRTLGRPRYAWLAVALFVATAIVAFDRPHASWPRNEWYGQEVLAQLIAPMPASFRAFGSLHIGGVAGFAHGPAYVDDRFINVPAVDAWSWMTIFACTFAALTALATVSGDAERQRDRTALYVGLGFWLVPALLLGPPGVWKHGMPFGQSFDGVYLQYFGIAVMVTEGVLRIRGSLGRAALLAPSLVALAVFLLSYGNARANTVSILKTQRVASSIALIERAGAAGFFDVLPSGRTIAVASSDSFASGIHSSVSDAKYALYHYSKRRYHIIATDRLQRLPKVDAWALQTSQTSGIFITLAHISDDRERTIRSDRAYGFSAFQNVWDTLAIPARGVLLRTRRLRDGFTIGARRTCGPVSIDRVYAPDVPTFLWGDGFHRRGPVGYVTSGAVAVTEMFMEARASLTLLPTKCPPRSLRFTATIETAAPATLVTRYPKRMEKLFVTSSAPLVVRTPASRSSVQIRFLTDAPIADWNPIYFRYDRDRPRDLRLRFSAASVAEEAVSTSPRRRTGQD